MLTSSYNDRGIRGERVASVATGRRYVVRNVVCHDCIFDSVHLAKPWPLKRRHEFNNVTAIRCFFESCSVEYSTFRDVTLKACAAGEGGIVLDDCSLHKVIFEGEFGSLRVLPAGDGGTQGQDPEAGAESWCIDVRNARFGEVEFLGLPEGTTRSTSCPVSALTRKY
jgi:hypothetical protein